MEVMQMNKNAEISLEKYLEKTFMLDYENRSIQNLIHIRKWNQLDDFHKIQKIYNFIKDEIKFGYNINDTIPSSRVLHDGYGQCNTKGTLFMSLLRAVGIPCRIHGFTIDKKLQKGAMTKLSFRLAPKNIVHSWVEILYDGVWYNLEGFIIDYDYLSSLQAKFSNCKGAFCGYGIAVQDFNNPMIQWNGNDTYIQKEGINQDFGIYDNPDTFFKDHSQQMNLMKSILYSYFIRHQMNKNINKLRKGK